MILPLLAGKGAPKDPTRWEYIPAGSQFERNARGYPFMYPIHDNMAPTAPPSLERAALGNAFAVADHCPRLGRRDERRRRSGRPLRPAAGAAGYRAG